MREIVGVGEFGDNKGAREKGVIEVVQVHLPLTESEVLDLSTATNL